MPTWDNNGDAQKFLYELLLAALLHSGNNPIHLGHNGLNGSFIWHGLTTGIPSLEITLCGLAPRSWERAPSPFETKEGRMPIKSKQEALVPNYTGDICPECGTMLVAEAGCSLCRACGMSKC